MDRRAQAQASGRQPAKAARPSQPMTAAARLEDGSLVDARLVGL
jgi:hypothetical protein